MKQPIPMNRVRLVITASLFLSVRAFVLTNGSRCLRCRLVFWNQRCKRLEPRAKQNRVGEVKGNGGSTGRTRPIVLSERRAHPRVIQSQLFARSFDSFRIDDKFWTVFLESYLMVTIRYTKLTLMLLFVNTV